MLKTANEVSNNDHKVKNNYYIKRKFSLKLKK